MEKPNIKVIGLAAVGAAAVVALRRGRVGPDPAHAPGHTHRGPAPEVKESGPARGPGRSARNQPWIRRSHSDSQQRRFRR
ncbi:MAG: hypothetical protein GY929_03755 [Actinomycetia bacterium]|nr:hypothetical protein [Actinomycetes bacterium]